MCRAESKVSEAESARVTLRAHRPNLHRRYMLIVHASSPTGVADVSGNLLDGNRDGKPGDNYVAILRGVRARQARGAFKRLIRDQLQGQPLSSRATLTKHVRAGGAGLAQGDGPGQPGQRSSPHYKEKLQPRNRFSTGGFSHSRLGEDREAAHSGGSGDLGGVRGLVLQVVSAGGILGRGQRGPLLILSAIWQRWAISP